MRRKHAYSCTEHAGRSGADLGTSNGAPRGELAIIGTHQSQGVDDPQISACINCNIEVYLSGGLYRVLFSCHCRGTSREKINPDDTEERH
jgi:hypothetical protein